jgi:hypothetical protein
MQHRPLRSAVGALPVSARRVTVERVKRADGESVELQLPGPAGAPTAFFRARRDGVHVETEAVRVGGKATPKVARTTHGDLREARTMLEKAVHAKLRAGYVEMGGGAGPGPRLVLRAATPCSGSAFDLSPDGSFAVAAGTKQGGRGFVIRRYEIATGMQRDLLDVDLPPGGPTDILHEVLIDAGGAHVVYALHARTVRRDLATNHEEVLASYRQWNAVRFRASTFSPFALRPTFDAARRRLLVFDDDHQVRVLGPDLATLFACDGNTETAETHAAALSPSGRRLALYVVSRHKTRNHADAAGDSTNEIRVYDVDAGDLLHALPCAETVWRLEFTPDDAVLLVWPGYRLGPVARDLATGREIHRFTRRFGPAMAVANTAQTSSAAYSPDGRLLALGAQGLWVHSTDPISGRPAAIEEPGLQLFDAKTFEPCEFQPNWHGIAARCAWSADSTRVAVVGGAQFALWRVDGLAP